MREKSKMIRRLVGVYSILIIACCGVNTIASTPDIGYAVVVAGHNKGVFDRISINNNADRAYLALLNLGFEPNDILYLNSDRPRDINGNGSDAVDMNCTKDNFMYVMEQLVPERVNQFSPLILYMVGHGRIDEFFVEEAKDVNPDFLDHYLSALPEGTPMIVIIDACYSGSFITPSIQGEISAPNRIIITSCHDDQETWTAIFSGELWLHLGEGMNIREAFIRATEASNGLFSRAGLTLWSGFRTTRFRPWLDDNGDANGHPPEDLADDSDVAGNTVIGTPGPSPWVGENAPNATVFQDCYTKNGGAAILGYPVNRVHWWESGHIQNFRGGEGYEGAIMQPADVNCAYAVYGSIWSKYVIMGGASKSLGYPSTDEKEGTTSSITNAGCRYSKFEGGAIVHRKANGEYESRTVFLGHGIFNKWEELGYGASDLGLPITDEYMNDVNYPQCDFEGGYITTTNGTTYQATYCTAMIHGDVDGDCKVDHSDLVVIASQWLEDENLEPNSTQQVIWPMFRYDALQTGRSPSVGPRTQRTMWTFDFPESCSSRVVIGPQDIVYVGRCDGIYSIEPTGTLRWFYELPCVSALCTGQDGATYAIFREGLSAVDRNGNELWQYALPNHSEESGLVIFRDKLYLLAYCVFPSEDMHPSLFCFNCDETISWIYDIVDEKLYPNPGFLAAPSGWLGGKGGPVGTPAIARDGTIYIKYQNAPYSHTLYSFNPAGEVKWKRIFESQVQISDPSIAEDGTILLRVGYYFYAISPDGGDVWTYNFAIGFSCGGTWLAPLIGSNGTSYWQFAYNAWGYAEPVLYAMDSRGELIWRKKIPTEFGNIGSDASAAIDNAGTIFLFNNSTLGAFNHEGKEIWKITTSGTAPKWLSQGGLAIGSDGRLYAATTQRLYAFRDKQGLQADVDNDSMINFHDFAIMAEHWLECNLVSE